MGEPHILTTLRRKREEIERVIEFHLNGAEAGRFDLAAVERSIALFEPRNRNSVPAYFELGRLWERGEILAVCLTALENDGPLETRELTDRVIAAKGLEGVDDATRKSVTFRIVRVLMKARNRANVRNEAKRSGVGVWSVSATNGAQA